MDFTQPDFFPEILSSNPIQLRFESYHNKHPEQLDRLISAFREFCKKYGGCDMHAARCIVQQRYGHAPGRNLMPAYARKIAEGFPDLAGLIKTRPSHFD